MNKNCLICGHNQRLKELYPATFDTKSINAKIYSARRTPDRVHYRLVKCLNCGLIFSSPILPLNKITKFYRQSECTYAEQIPYTTKTYLQLFKSLRSQLPRHPKVLEVGCGNGFFLRAIKRLGADVWGVEPGRKMLKTTPSWLKRKVRKDIFRPGQFSRNSFNVVCIFHTLDHLTHPKAFLRTARAVLKPNGWILAVVHDTDSLSTRILGERSPIFDIEHIYLFNKINLKALFQKQSFKVTKVFDLINTYPLNYWLTMGGWQKWAKYLGRLGKLPVSLAGGNMAIIAQKYDQK